MSQCLLQESYLCPLLAPSNEFRNVGPKGGLQQPIPVDRERGDAEALELLINMYDPLGELTCLNLFPDECSSDGEKSGFPVITEKQVVDADTLFANNPFKNGEI